MLTDKQEKFAQSIGTPEFDFNRLAYEKHYDCSKMSKNAIYVETCKLIQHPNISLRIKEIREQTLQRNQVTLDEVIKELSEWLRFNIKTIFNTDGTMKQIHEITDQEAACIASYENVELFGNNGDGKAQIGYIRKVKLIDKQATADKFMKFYGAYIDNHKIIVEDLSHIKDMLKGIKN